jgi:hypothetical protein
MVAKIPFHEHASIFKNFFSCLLIFKQNKLECLFLTKHFLPSLISETQTIRTKLTKAAYDAQLNV